MGNKLHKRHDSLGTVLIDETGSPQGLYTRCPHCDMVDLKHINQGIKQTHFRNWKVKGIGKYDCGKCRHTFYTLEIQIPDGMDPMALYEQINSLYKESNPR